MTRIHRARLALLAAALVLSAAGPVFAQLSGIQGTVADASRAVLPGAVVRITHLDTGIDQETVTNAEGRYFFQGVRIGQYALNVDLLGFAAVRRTGLVVEVGQTVTIDVQLQLAALQEQITVSGGTPLVNLVESKIGGNLNIRQMEESPLNGRQWTMMTNLAPGARGTGATAGWTIGNAPIFGAGTGITKINVDGAQINSAKNGNGGTLDFSQYAIQEVEVLSNRFGAQNARASGGVLNAITKSGTNTLSGSFYGFLRDDSLNARDFFTGQVRPFRDTQVGAVLGGPVRRNRAFYFFSWESERAPTRQNFVTGIPALDVSYQNNTVRDIFFVKGDYQRSPSQRLTGSVNKTKVIREVTTIDQHVTTGVAAPAFAYSPSLKHTWTLADNVLNEVSGSYIHFHRPIQSSLRFQTLGDEREFRPANDTSSWYRQVTFPYLNFPQAKLGNPSTGWALGDEDFVQLKNDFSIVTHGRSGEHALHAGGEYLYQHVWGINANFEFGNYVFNANPTDWNAVIAVVEAGDRAGLQRLVDTGVVPQPVNFIQAIGDSEHNVRIHSWGGYVQDDWRITSRVTANLGLRYDIEVGLLNAAYNRTRFLSRPDLQGRPNSDADNWQPRVGAVWALDEESRTVLRGGAGRYFDQSYSNQMSQIIQQNNGDDLFTANVLNDRGAAFMSNPLLRYGGQACDATVLLRIQDPADCGTALIAAGLATDVRGVVPWYGISYTDQYSIGVQRQIGHSLAVQADVVRMDGHDESYTRNINLWVDCGNGERGTYPACTGPTLPVATYGRPDARFATATVSSSDGYSRYDALQLNVTKRFSRRHSYQVSYILSKTNSTNGSPVENGLPISAQYGPSANDERHRLTAVGSVELPLGVRLSSVFFTSSGVAYRWTSGRDADGDLSLTDRALAADGSKLPVNAGRSAPVYRLDLRLTKRVRVAGRFEAEGIVELFNALNYRNFITYNGNQRSLVFGRPQPTDNLSYQPRMGQVGFRLLW